MKHIHLISVFVALVFATLAMAQNADDWSGRWETYWRDGEAVMTLTQDADSVSGKFEPGNGRIEGRLEERVLRGKWIQDGAEGPILFALSDDGESFTGRFGDGEYWNGRRIASIAGADVAEVPPASPREALQRFVRLENAVTYAGDISAAGKAEAVLFYDGELADMRERRRRRQLLWTIIDLSTFRIYDAPARADGDTATFAISPAAADIEYPLKFQKVEDAWFIVVESESRLGNFLDRTLKALGQDSLTAHNAARANSPRAVMRDFLQGMRSWHDGGKESVLSTLDLSFVPPRLYDFEAPLFAEYLKQVIDRAGYVTWQEIPDNPERAAPYVFYRHPVGSVVIDLAGGTGTEPARWKFTADTLRSAPVLFGAMQDLPVAETIAPFSSNTHFFEMRERIRATAPVLLRRIGPIDLWQWLAVPAIVFLSLFLGWLSRAIVSRAQRVPEGEVTGTASNRSANGFGWPLGILVASGVAVLAFTWTGLAVTLLGPLTVGLAGIAVASVAWLVFVILDVLGGFFRRRAERTQGYVDEIATSLAFGVLKVGVIALGIIAIADVTGLPYEGILAGLGVGGLALAFAARDTVTNLISGALLMSDRPFRRGDLVETGTTLATVEHVGLRSTRMRTLDDSILIIPNSQLTDHSIVNWGQRRKRKIRLAISLTYDTPREKLDAFVSELRTLYLGQPDADDTTGYVGLKSFGASSLDVELWGYFNVSDYSAQVEAQHRLIADIIELAGRLDVQFAFPTRTIRIVPEDAKVAAIPD